MQQRSWIGYAQAQNSATGTTRTLRVRRYRAYLGAASNGCLGRIIQGAMSSFAYPSERGGNLMLLVSTAQLITGKSLFHTGGGIAIKL
ncbi:MAG: hypothetical protein CBD16_08935 [Betaproteobacteria bacterium TMED156]|nr:MAG: hypothetical protein CBD16_08935 [Betaproteobacteria bacterium TMED156]